MASYTISPIWGAGAQLFDNNGNPLSGGQIYTYLAGTNTPTATWTTPAGNIQNSNPIIANAAGRLTNEIWLLTGTSYKFVLKDANDVLIATYDNIPSLNAVPITNDASSIYYEEGYTVTAGGFIVGATYLITSVGTTDFTAIGAAANTTGLHFVATGAGTGTGTAQYSRTAQSKFQEYVSVLDFDADPTGVRDSTVQIQAALDSGAKTVLFPPGNYKVSAVEGDEACLYLTRNVNLVGTAGQRHCTITASLSGVTTASVIKISMTNPFGGFGDVRGWFIDGIGFGLTGGGKHGIYMNGGVPIYTSKITNCAFSGNVTNGGYGLYIDTGFAHSEVSLCTISNGVYAKCYDANVFYKNLSFGTPAGFTFDLVGGVRNNIVRDNTIVNRDGAVIIINGSNIRIVNNQMEQGAFYTPTNENQNAVSSMVWVQNGSNTVISQNNFGGGTNVNHAIYLDTANRTVIENNNFIATDTEDVYMTANSSYNIFDNNNKVIGSIADPRPNQLFKALITDLGVGNMGTQKTSSDISLYNSWTCEDFYKNPDGYINFLNGFNGGTTTANTLMAILPNGFLPYYSDVTDSVRRNLFNNSQNFVSGSWFYGALDLTTNNTTAPDVTVTGTKVDQKSGITTAGSVYINYASYTAVSYVLSVFVKAGTKPYCVLYAKGVSTWFDVSNGTIGTTGAGHTPSISYYGNGWWRCSIVYTGNAGYQSTGFGFADTDGSTTVVDSGGGYAWGAQLEQASSISQYQKISGSTYTTIYLKQSYVCSTDGGTGSVIITRNGNVIVDSLPSNSQVILPMIQCSQTQPA